MEDDLSEASIRRQVRKLATTYGLLFGEGDSVAVADQFEAEFLTRFNLRKEESTPPDG